MYAIILLVAGIYSLVHLNTLTDKILGTLLCLGGSIWGCEFPDIDSPKSIPRRHHPIIGIFFELFNIEHRGKFSHSILSETLFWFAVWFLAIIGITFIDNQYQTYIIKAIIVIGLAQVINKITVDSHALFKSNVFKTGQFILLLRYYCTIDKEYAKQLQYRQLNPSDELVFKVLSYILSIFIVMTLPNEKSNLLIFTSLFIFGILTGVYSHLFGDISTYQGIWLGWHKQVHPVKTLAQLPFFNLMIPNQGKTGGAWEDRFRIVTSLIVLILFVILILNLFN